MALIQWNSHGARGNFPELKQHLTNVQPACVAFQETFFPTVDKFSSCGFFCSSQIGLVPVFVGIALLVITSFPTLPVPLTTCLAWKLLLFVWLSLT